MVHFTSEYKMASEASPVMEIIVNDNTTAPHNINDNNGMEDGGGDRYQCSGATDAELQLFGQISFWTGGVVQAAVCLIGLMANSVSIPVLRSKDMYVSTFNRLLIVLALADNLYLVLAFLECLRQEMNLSTNAHTSIFVYALYPLHNITLCISIYLTMILAMERYRAVSQPIDYHAIIVSGRQWQRVTRYVLPVLVFSLCFNIPKFFELRTNTTSFPHPNDSSLTVTRMSIAPTKLRLNDDYTTYYHHYARLLVTGVIPLVALIFFNWRIYNAFKLRRKNMRGLLSANNSHSQQAAEENRQALILFAVVALFVICHVPRNFLSLHEALTFETKKQDYFHNCGGMPLWILLIGLVSHLLLTFNSGFNFFLYCAMSDPFRTELKRLLGEWAQLLTRIVSCKTRKTDTNKNSSPTKSESLVPDPAVEATPLQIRHIGTRV